MWNEGALMGLVGLRKTTENVSGWLISRPVIEGGTFRVRNGRVVSTSECCTKQNLYTACGHL
jgi:hypothetical protein